MACGHSNAACCMATNIAQEIWEVRLKLCYMHDHARACMNECIHHHSSIHVPTTSHKSDTVYQSALYWKLMAVGRIGHKQPAANHLLSENVSNHHRFTEKGSQNWSLQEMTTHHRQHSS